MKFFLWTLMVVSLGLSAGCSRSNTQPSPNSNTQASPNTSQPTTDHETMQQHMGY